MLSEYSSCERNDEGVGVHRLRVACATCHQVCCAWQMTGADAAGWTFDGEEEGGLPAVPPSRGGLDSPSAAS
jgi:hypothetical protein